MLAAAFAAACVAVVTGSAWVALLGAIIVGILMALLHGLACITYRGNQVVSGVAINIMAAGLTVVLGNAWFGRGGQTPDLAPAARFMPLKIPGAESAFGIPVVGPIYSNVIGGHNLLVYVAFITVPIAWWVLYHTRFGLRLRAVGEDPKVVDTAGISVAWLRYRAVIIAGTLCGFAGAYLAIAQNAGFSPQMTAGRGFIALAAMVFGKWRPWPAMFACLLFGLLDAIAIRLQGTKFPGIGEVPVEFIQALPYILTVVLLARWPPTRWGNPTSRSVELMDQHLFAAASAAMERAYAPYSKFQVGAAILAENGRIYSGCNVENAAYPVGTCAEAGAISAMIRDGALQIREIVVIGHGDKLCTPCGGCRQRIREFAASETKVHVCGPEGLRRTYTRDELLPDSFGPENLA
jgi:simple sugar transport system permease protein